MEVGILCNTDRKDISPKAISKYNKMIFFKCLSTDTGTFTYLFIFNWRIIALQYCIGFCHIYLGNFASSN